MISGACNVQKPCIVVAREGDDGDVLTFQQILDEVVEGGKRGLCPKLTDRVGKRNALVLFLCLFAPRAGVEIGLRIDEDILFFFDAESLVGQDVAKGADASALTAFNVEKQIIHKNIIAHSL